MTASELLTVFFTTLGIFAAVLGKFGYTVMALAMDAIIVIFALKTEAIPVDPPNVALVKFMGFLINTIIRPRWVFVLWPFEELVLIDVSKKTVAVKFDGVRTRADAATQDEVRSEEEGALTAQVQVPTKTPRSGATMRGEMSITFGADDTSGQRLKLFIRSGREEGVRTIITNLTDQAIREVSARLTWEQLVFSRAELSALIISKLTGQQPTQKVLLDANGRPILNTDPDDPALYQTRERRDDESFTAVDIQQFVDTVLVNGKNDIRGIGIKLLQIIMIELEPEDKGLREDSNRLAREQQQARSEAEDIDTETRLAEIYVAKARARGETISMKDALEYVRIRRNPNVRETFFRSAPGGAKPFVMVGPDGEPVAHGPTNEDHTPDGTQGGTSS